MSVPQLVSATKKISYTEARAEAERRRVALEMRKAIRENPSGYTNSQKDDNDVLIAEFADRDVAAASGYTLISHDFITPFACHGVADTDDLISNIIHILRSDHVAAVPSVLVLILDNATVNKNIFTLRAFALLLELIPRLKEVHLMFPSVGHTHNSLDAHFGNVCNLLKTNEVGTPEGGMLHFHVR